MMSSFDLGSAKLNLQQFGITILFGVTSILFGFTRYEVPRLDGVYSDFREIPLLIALFYIRKPFFIVTLSLLKSLSALFTEGSSFSSTFLMHAIGLVATWMCFNFFEKKQLSIKTEVALWIGLVLIYYIVFLIPVMLFIDNLLSYKSALNFVVYKSVAQISYFEILSSILVTALYLIQVRSRQALIILNTSLEDRIKQRTEQLALANENLEQLVLKRTKIINSQVEKLKSYAHSNSHEVRGPLARILGLVKLIDMERDVNTKLKIVEKINKEATELDIIIKKVNDVLKEGSF